jgi:hypothetical protein
MSDKKTTQFSKSRTMYSGSDEIGYSTTESPGFLSKLALVVDNTKERARADASTYYFNILLFTGFYRDLPTELTRLRHKTRSFFDFVPGAALHRVSIHHPDSADRRQSLRCKFYQREHCCCLRPPIGGAPTS